MRNIRFILSGFPRKSNGGLLVIMRHIRNLPQQNFTLVFVKGKFNLPFFKKILNIARFKLARIFNEIPRWSNLSRNNVTVEYVDSIDEAINITEINILTTAAQVVICMNNSKVLKSLIYFAQHWEFWEQEENVLKSIWQTTIPKITCSKWLAEYAKKYNAVNVHVVVNGVYEKKQKRNIGARSTDVLAMLSPISWKRSEQIISICNKLQKQRRMNKQQKLNFVFFAVTNEIWDLPKNSTLYVNPSREKIDELYRMSKIMLVCSTLEGFCLPAAEAMAHGCVLVTSACGGVNDFAINDTNAIVVSNMRDQDFVEVVDDLLVDEDKWQRLSAAAYMTVDSDFTYVASAWRFYSVLKLLEK